MVTSRRVQPVRAVGGLEVYLSSAAAATILYIEGGSGILARRVGRLGGPAVRAAFGQLPLS